MLRSLALRRLFAVSVCMSLLALLAIPTVVLGHEEREVAGVSMEVGFIDEPVFVGNRSGMEVFANRSGTPVEGLETTLNAKVNAQGKARPLTLEPAFGKAGAYKSYFIPTAAGQYTFHLTGTIEGTAVDETFTSGPDTFGDVEDSAAGQFPNQLPAPADLAAQAKQGADAAGQVTIAIGLGAAGLVAGLAALGLALARGRPAQ